jgi:dTDP-4-dehydrorhamnose 3,5-epimerase
MDNTKMIILGANGQLGKALQARFPGARAFGRDTFDMTDWETMRKYDWAGVEAILNAAVFANVDGAETPEGRVAAWKVNAVGPSYLAKIATERNITLVHVSSDYVFDGTKTPHHEDEPFAPLGVYGQSKAAGDIAVAVTPRHYIARTTWLVGDGPNFVRTMVGLAKKNVSPTVVADQIGRLTFASTLANGIAHLLKNKTAYGTYNLTNNGEPASWADFTRAIFKELGRDDLKVTNTTTADYSKNKAGVAPRPLQSKMDLSKIKATGFIPQDWQAELHNYIQQETKEQ